MKRLLHVIKGLKPEVSSSPQQSNDVNVTWDYVGGKEGEVIWKIH